METKQGELKQAQGQLAAYTERYSSAEAAKEEMVLKQVAAREAQVATLKSHREQQEATCASFVDVTSQAIRRSVRLLGQFLTDCL